LELATRSAAVSSADPARAAMKEAEYTRKALAQSQDFLARAEEAYKSDPQRPDVIQFARTAAQCAENARALSMGAVGGVLVRQLEDELANLRGELGRRKPAAIAPATSSEQPVKVVEKIVEKLVHVPTESAAPPPLVKQPALWFGMAGWGLAIVVLFRNRAM
jgi:hypothetical protein